MTELVDYYHAVERLHGEARGRCDWNENLRHSWVRARIQEFNTGWKSLAQEHLCIRRTGGVGSHFHFGNICCFRRQDLQGSVMQSGRLHRRWLHQAGSIAGHLHLNLSPYNSALLCTPLKASSGLEEAWPHSLRSRLLVRVFGNHQLPPRQNDRSCKAPAKNRLLVDERPAEKFHESIQKL